MTTTSNVTINISSEQATQLVAALQSMGIGDVSVQPVVPSYQQIEQDNQDQFENVNGDLTSPVDEDLGVISMDDEDEARQCEVSAVIGHTKPHPADGINSWMFEVQFKDGTTEWVREDDCHCDKLISEYLKRANIRTVYCFCRVSSKNQASPGHVSLDAQEAKITSWSALLETSKGAPKVHQSHQGSPYRTKVVRATRSAYTRIPKELKRIGELANPLDKILVYRVDRLSRHVNGFVEWLDNLHDKGVIVSSLSESIDYKGKNDIVFLQHLLEATKESIVIGERVRMSIEHRRSKGQFVGGLSYGKKRVMVSPGDYKIEDNASECAIITRIVSSWPAVTDRSLAEQLNAEGVTKKGRKWTYSMVGYIRDKNGRRKTPRMNLKTATRPRHTRLQMVMEVVARNSRDSLSSRWQRTTTGGVSRSVIRGQLDGAMSNTVLNKVLREAVSNGLLTKHRDSFRTTNK